MDINIYVNQKKINPLCRSAIAEYVKRLSPYCNMNIVCAPGHVKYTQTHSSAHYAITYAADNPMNMTSPDTISSEEFAALINSVTSGGISKLSYHIGYPSDETVEMGSFSVCTITPSHDMTTLLLSEQIYRAYTILNNITYHK